MVDLKGEWSTKVGAWKSQASRSLVDFKASQAPEWVQTESGEPSKQCKKQQLVIASRGEGGELGCIKAVFARLTRIVVVVSCLLAH